MPSKIERWIVVLGGIICQFCVGMLYSWSLYKNPIIKQMGWPEPAVSLTFSIATFIIPFVMIFAGSILPKLGPKKVILIGAVTMTAGLIVASLAKSPLMLQLGYGVLGGTGVGFVYGVPIATCVKWFPDKKGLITGLTVAGFGLGSIIFAPIATFLIANTGSFATFRIQALITIVGILIGVTMVRSAPNGYAPEGWTPPSSSAANAALREYSSGEMLKTPQYWFLLIMYLFANASGLMVIGHASPIAQQVAGLTPAEAGLIVSVLAIANTAGRFFAGAAVDAFGAKKVVAFVYIVNAALLVSLKFMTTFPLIALAIGGLAVCFGAMMGAYPNIVLDFFGAKSYSVNYALVFIAYGIGGVLGPQIASLSLKTGGGTYDMAFILVGMSCVIGAIMAMMAQKPKDRRIT